MFLMWLFSFFDLLILVAMLLTHFDMVSSWRLLVGGAAWFGTKAFLFRGDLFSMIDLVVGIYLILMLLGARWTLTWVFAIYLGYKLLAFTYGVLTR